MRTLIFATLLLALAACAGPAAPPDSFYRIEPGAPPSRFSQPVLPGVMEVERPAADGVVAERALAFARTEDGPLAHYKYDFWSEPPSLLLQDRLAHYLADAGVAVRVVTPDLRVLPDWEVRGKIRRFEMIADKGVAVADLELAVVGSKDGKLLLLKTYDARMPTGSGSVGDSARAMEKAVADIFARFLADLARVRP